MTGIQLRKLLDRVGFSQRGTAKSLEIDERTMRRYIAIAGDHIPKVVEYAVLWITQDMLSARSIRVKS